MLRVSGKGLNVMRDESINTDLKQSALEREFFSEGMFAKDDKEAAGKYLLAASNLLLEGSEIPIALRISLGQALRESALVAFEHGNEKAGDVLLKAVGLKKGGSDRKLIQAARVGNCTNEELGGRFNIGKDQVAKKLNVVKSQELELLNRRLSHTVQRLLLILSQQAKGEFTTPQVTTILREYLTSQNMLVSESDISDHVREAIKLAKKEYLVIEQGNVIFLNLEKLP